MANLSGSFQEGKGVSSDLGEQYEARSRSTVLAAVHSIENEASKQLLFTPGQSPQANNTAAQGGSRQEATHPTPAGSPAAFKPYELSMLVWSFARIGERVPQLSAAVAHYFNQYPECIQEMDGQQIANLLWSSSKLRWKHEGW